MGGWDLPPAPGPIHLLSLWWARAVVPDWDLLPVRRGAMAACRVLACRVLATASMRSERLRQIASCSSWPRGSYWERA